MRWLAVLAILPIVIGCGGGGGSGDTVAPSGENQTWVAAFKTSDGMGAAALELYRVGDQVTGTYQTSIGGEGDIAGTIGGGRVKVTLTQTNDCPGTIVITGTIADDYDIAGMLTGSDCQRGYDGSTTRAIRLDGRSEGLGFSGDYYGISSGSLLYLGIETLNESEYEGDMVHIEWYDLLLTTGAVRGALGDAVNECNTGGSFPTVLGLNVFDLKSEEVNESDLGYVCIVSMFQDGDGLNDLAASLIFHSADGSEVNGMGRFPLRQFP